MQPAPPSFQYGCSIVQHCAGVSSWMPCSRDMRHNEALVRKTLGLTSGQTATCHLLWSLMCVLTNPMQLLYTCAGQVPRVAQAPLRLILAPLDTAVDTKAFPVPALHCCAHDWCASCRNTVVQLCVRLASCHRLRVLRWRHATHHHCFLTGLALSLYSCRMSIEYALAAACLSHHLGPNSQRLTVHAAACDVAVLMREAACSSSSHIGVDEACQTCQWMCCAASTARQYYVIT